MNEGQTMTAEDKMRKAALTIYGDTPVSQVEKDAFKNGWQSCAAQSAETIARLEEENRRLNDVVINQTIYSAAAQLDNERLREALEAVFSIIADPDIPGMPGSPLELAREALAKPLDTATLDAYVAEKTAELQAKVDALKWRPIETAPKDGTIVDLMIDGERITDCYWGLPDHSCGEAGRYCDSDWHSLSDYWVCSIFNEQLGEGATSWMPLPPSANTQGVE